MANEVGIVTINPQFGEAESIQLALLEARREAEQYGKIIIVAEKRQMYVELMKHVAIEGVRFVWTKNMDDICRLLSISTAYEIVYFLDNTQLYRNICFDMLCIINERLSFPETTMAKTEEGLRAIMEFFPISDDHKNMAVWRFMLVFIERASGRTANSLGWPLPQDFEDAKTRFCRAHDSFDMTVESMQLIMCFRQFCTYIDMAAIGVNFIAAV